MSKKHYVIEARKRALVEEKEHGKKRIVIDNVVSLTENGGVIFAVLLVFLYVSRLGSLSVNGRKGQPMKRMKPFTVEVKSTLGAGDSFKAGCVYGLLHGMEDDELVRFASACSAIAISRFPLPLNPPTMEEVKTLLERGN